MTFFISAYSGFEKAGSQVINLETRRECDDIMQQIYGEDRSYWPYGLDRLGHDDLFLIREANTKKAIGFTGWQERREGLRKVGYYSIGILPEYRRNGFAKQALAALISQKAASVDRVQAFIMPHNGPSHALAASLGIPVVHEAGGEVVKSAGVLGNTHIPTRSSGLGGLAAGTAASLFWDYLQHPKSKYPFDPAGGENDRWRLGNALLNGTLVGGPIAAHYPLTTAMTGFALTPAKDLMVQAFPAVSKLPGALDAMQTAAKSQPDNSKMLGIIAGLGAAGVVGGGLLGYKLLKTLRDSQNRGHVKVKLPTRDPRDQETTVEMPITDARIPANLYESLGRDTRRKLREESKERTWRRGSKHNLLTHADKGTAANLRLLEQEDEDEAPKRKAASIENLLAAVNQICQA